MLMRALVDRTDFHSEPEDGTIVHLVKALELEPDGALARLADQAPLSPESAAAGRSGPS